LRSFTAVANTTHPFSSYLLLAKEIIMRGPEKEKQPRRPAAGDPPRGGPQVPGAGAGKSVLEAVGQRIGTEALQLSDERAKALESFQAQWTREVAPVLEKETGIVPAELESDVRKLVETDDEGERAKLGVALQDRYGKAIGTVSSRLGAQLPPPSGLVLASTARTGPCPIDNADALRILLCGGFGLCACPAQRIANPSIFTPPAATGGFQFSADPAAGSLYVRDRFAILGAPHTFARLSGSFTVPGNLTIVNVFLPVTIGHATVTLSGLGYSHGWATLRLRVVDQIDAERDVVNCEQELINHWTWAGGFDTIHHRPASGPVGLMGCFTRAATATPQSFLFSVELTADGTVAGFGGVQVSASAVVSSMLLVTCP
jgi:hypothetical protein